MATATTIAIAKFLAKHPDAKPREIYRTLGLKSADVYNYLSRNPRPSKVAEEETIDQLDLPLEPAAPLTRQEQLTSGVDCILNERAATYGLFIGQAQLSQAFKSILHDALAERNKLLEADQQEALEMMLHKIARVVNGDSNYIDSWSDIAGYATLVAERLQGNTR